MNKIKGITLIALVITIIVLLILAGVSIAMLTGQNGILNQANEAKEQTEIGREKEYIKLAFSASKSSKLSKADTSAVTSEELKTEIIKSTSNVEVTNANGVDLQVFYTDSNRTYIVDQNGEITLDETPVIPPKHPDQSSTNNDIGIDEDGNAVNMDYWKSSIQEGAIALNEGIGSYQQNGYIGPIVDGKIVGNVPKYVKKADKNIALKVKYLDATFKGLQQLVVAPKIPDSIISIQATFEYCSNLTTAPNISSNITNIRYAFYACSSLTGNIEINASIGETDFYYYWETFTAAATNEGTNLIVTGTSTGLDKIIATKSTNSHITKGN